MAATFHVPSASVLMAAGQREVASLAELLAATQPGQSVHGARRRIKLLRSLLRLLRLSSCSDACREANAALREAADALAGHRRAEALVTAAEKLAARSGDSGVFWRDLAQAHRNSHMEDAGQALAIAQQSISRAAAALASAPSEGHDETAVRDAFLGAYGKARRKLRDGLASGDAPTLHEARKNVIHHLHQLKLLRPGRLRRLAALEQLREILGDLNDLDELQQLARSTPIPEPDTRLMRKARKHLLGEAEDASARLFRHRPDAFGKRMGHAAAARSRRARLALQGGE